jgi:hypothetical protein
LKPNFASEMALKRAGATLYLHPASKPYEQVVTRLERTTLRSFQREGQLEETDEQEAPKPRKGYFRAAVIYRPDPYLPCYALWHRYGGIKDGRERLETLTSSLPKASGS